MACTPPEQLRKFFLVSSYHFCLGLPEWKDLQTDVPPSTESLSSTCSTQSTPCRAISASQEAGVSRPLTHGRISLPILRQAPSSGYSSLPDSFSDCWERELSISTRSRLEDRLGLLSAKTLLWGKLTIQSIVLVSHHIVFIKNILGVHGAGDRTRVLSMLGTCSMVNPCPVRVSLDTSRLSQTCNLPASAS